MPSLTDEPSANLSTYPTTALLNGHAAGSGRAQVCSSDRLSGIQDFICVCFSSAEICTLTLTILLILQNDDPFRLGLQGFILQAQAMSAYQPFQLVLF